MTSSCFNLATPESLTRGLPCDIWGSNPGFRLGAQGEGQNPALQPAWSQPQPQLRALGLQHSKTKTVLGIFTCKRAVGCFFCLLFVFQEVRAGLFKPLAKAAVPPMSSLLTSVATTRQPVAAPIPGTIFGLFRTFWSLQCHAVGFPPGQGPHSPQPCRAGRGRPHGHRVWCQGHRWPPATSTSARRRSAQQTCLVRAARAKCWEAELSSLAGFLPKNTFGMGVTSRSLEPKRSSRAGRVGFRGGSWMRPLPRESCWLHGLG